MIRDCYSEAARLCPDELASESRVGITRCMVRKKANISQLCKGHFQVTLHKTTFDYLKPTDAQVTAMGPAPSGQELRVHHQRRSAGWCRQDLRAPQAARVSHVGQRRHQPRSRRGTAPMNLRLEALKLAVASQGNPNKLGLAKEYLEFLEGPAATVAVLNALPGGRSRLRRRQPSCRSKASSQSDRPLACVPRGSRAAVSRRVRSSSRDRTRRLTKQTDLGAPFAGNF
jgi:hypothetical protein